MLDRRGGPRTISRTTDGDLECTFVENTLSFIVPNIGRARAHLNDPPAVFVTIAVCDHQTVKLAESFSMPEGHRGNVRVWKRSKNVGLRAAWFETCYYPGLFGYYARWGLTRSGH